MPTSNFRIFEVEHYHLWVLLGFGFLFCWGVFVNNSAFFLAENAEQAALKISSSKLRFFSGMKHQLQRDY